MERVNNLLTFPDYLRIAATLVAHDDGVVRRKTIEVCLSRR